MTIAALQEILEHSATDPNGVEPEVVNDQLATASLLRQRLDANGGVILGDEVGAGKTFVTFAILAETLLRQPGRGAIVFAPSDPLVRKWSRQMREYLSIAVKDREAGEKLVQRVVVMDRSLHVEDRAGRRRRPRRDDIVITQHSVFSRQTSDYDRARCLEQWLTLRYQKVSGGSRAPRKRLFEACGLDRGKLVTGSPAWAHDDVLKTSQLAALDAVWTRYAAGERDLNRSMKRAVLQVRASVGRRLLPDVALAVVDEAHNLRATTSQVYLTLMDVLHAKFDGLLFLTATPFQLGRHELSSIVEFFRSARVPSGGGQAFDERLTLMQAGMDGYVHALSDFGEAWADLDVDDVAEVEAAAGDHATFSQERSRVAWLAYRAAVVAKDDLETGLRPFLVRSVRHRHHLEQPGVEVIPPESRVPVALVDRLVHERLTSGSKTFVASALTSACSSWEALFEASITTGASSRTLLALQELRDRNLLGEHPKTGSTLQNCLAGLSDSEKTLVFVERVTTGTALRDALTTALGTGHDRNAYQRLQSPRRFGWPSLRENYIHTLYPDAFGRPPTPHQVLNTARLRTSRALWARVDEEGPLSYRTAKRFVEHVTFRAAAVRHPDWDSQRLPAEVRDAVGCILDPDYVLNGLDLGASSESYQPLPGRQPSAKRREVGDAFVKAFAKYRSPWSSSVQWLRQLPPDARSELVEAAASAIASSHLQAEIERQEVDGDPAAHFRQTQALLLAETGSWVGRFQAIARQAADALAGAERPDAIRSLAAALQHGRRVMFIDGSTANDTKQLAIEGFNTPLYPEILIATGVLGEGIDLHRSCRRVIHHDLPWNPAKLEQRTGRIDRVGSLASRLRQQDGQVDESAVVVGLPYVSGTYDETIFRRVLARRREFRCLLGNRPEWDAADVAKREQQPLSNSVVEALQVRLGPAASPAVSSSSTRLRKEPR